MSADLQKTVPQPPVQVTPADADVQRAVLGAPPVPLRPDEITWSRKAALKTINYRRYSEAQEKMVAEGIAKYSPAIKYHVVLSTESGEPAGSGVCVKHGSRRGILTARHVIHADDEGRIRLPKPCICFMPPWDYMLRELRHRNKLIGGEGPLLGMPMAAASIGNRETVIPLQRPGKPCPDPGLPDIAIIAVSNDLEERLQKAAVEMGTITPEPQWIDLDTEDQVGIPYSTASDPESMLDDWTITGVRGERSGSKRMYSETCLCVVDRIYKRSEYEYYGMFAGKANGSRIESKDWKGTSGGGVWRQRLTQTGQRKILNIAPSPLTPEDLEPPVLGGIAFYHETRKNPEELRDSHGICHRSELYAHRIDGTLLGIIRRALNGQYTASR